MQITWLGHSSFKIKIRDKVIYIDPYAGEYDEKADIILISHSHYDHFNLEKINFLRNDETIIFGPSDVVSEVDGAELISINETKELDNLKITGVPMYSATHALGSGVGFVIEAAGKKLYHAGDAGLMSEFQEIKSDIALLPIGGTYTMNAQEAAEAVKMMQPKIAIPMHYGSIVGTIDDAENFRELVEDETKTQVRILEVGEVIEV